jgi:hypothetical protein
MARATYELRVRGHVSGSALDGLEGLGMRCDTVVSGIVQDQSALHGLLERVRDLGLELVEVHRVDDAAPDVLASGHGRTEPTRGLRHDTDADGAAGRGRR